ncbi:hypothetical protein [Megasphaera cerevisiae]|nr:hypothetical protein [Megasphaera cerevisiae]SKA25500.1 hypothetical protein SAMN05660900_03044 [Megasphaera cerevisiae DSM 20462]
MALIEASGAFTNDYYNENKEYTKTDESSGSNSLSSNADKNVCFFDFDDDFIIKEILAYLKYHYSEITLTNLYTDNYSDIHHDYNMSKYFQENLLGKKQGRSGSDSMDYQEKYFERLDRDISSTKEDIKEIDKNISNILDNKLNNFMGEIRDRDNQRHAEIIAMETRTNDSIKSLKNETVYTRRWIMGIFGTLVISCLVLLIKVIFFTVR